MLGVAKEAQSTEAAHAEWQDTFPGENPSGLLATHFFVVGVRCLSAGRT